ncbi:MAG: adenosyl-hopene transferase HpnH [Thermoguttaceae bacterium]|jgi:hopanoid biosynthesis associated radical SAM protein HpnH
MRFPFSLTRSMTSYLLRKRLAGEKKFPLVLMLEPLHACNLSCTGCGRIREYADTMHSRLSIERCLAAADECGAPIVSVCGGEPLIYPEIEVLVESLIMRRKHVYLCTNGTLLAKKIHGLRPSSRLLINVHLDGMEATHDRMVERPGVFEEAIHGIVAAKSAGFIVCTNTTVYRDTDMDEIAVLFDYLHELDVDGFMISPAFGYAAVRDVAPTSAADIFMTRDEVHAKFRSARATLKRFRLTASPIYMEFLRGERDLTCAAWANPTYNVRGWRGPCYLLGDAHYKTYRELVEATDWSHLGPGGDPRCQHCLTHCGFEPAAVLTTQKGFGDVLRMAVWQMT